MQGQIALKLENLNSFLLVHTIPIFDGKLSKEQAAKNINSTSMKYFLNKT